MSHKQLWAPWRLTYIQGDSEKAAKPAAELKLLPGGEPGCFICRAIADSDDRGNLVIHRGKLTVSILNRYPYNNGHILVAPQRHQGRLDQLTAEEHAEAIAELTRFVALMERLMKAQGFNVGLNLGQVAGAGVPGHLHWHVVPRWNGDTNFMTVVADARVLPETLEQTAARLRPIFATGTAAAGPPPGHVPGV
jgi:ATP adenylyltransferase